jgi:homoserine dehydrogenase
MMTFDLILIGYGNVARRFESLLAEQRPSLARIVGIATRRHGSTLNGRKATHATTLAFLKEPQTERRRRGGGARRRRDDDARYRSRRAGDEPRPGRAAGDAHVITANKGRWRSPTARWRGAAGPTELPLEGTVMDGVPIFNLVRRPCRRSPSWGSAAS